MLVRRRGLAAVEDGSAQTEGRAGLLVITQVAWTQAGAALRPSADSIGLLLEYGPRVKRSRVAAVDPTEDIAAQNAWMAGAAGSSPTAAEVANVFRSFPSLPRSSPDRGQRFTLSDPYAPRAGAAAYSGWESGAEDDGGTQSSAALDARGRLGLRRRRAAGRCDNAAALGWSSGSEYAGPPAPVIGWDSGSVHDSNSDTDSL